MSSDREVESGGLEIRSGTMDLQKRRHTFLSDAKIIKLRRYKFQVTFSIQTKCCGKAGHGGRWIGGNVQVAAKLLTKGRKTCDSTVNVGHLHYTVTDLVLGCSVSESISMTQKNLT